MKWIVITYPDFMSGEALFIDRLFGHGLDLLHLRKPGSTIEACRELLKQIPERWHSRIVLHDHFPLTGEFHLHGVHLNRHYPTGTITTIGRRQTLLRWAEDQDATIIEDDYDSEFRFAGRPIPALQSIDTGGRVVYMNTYSQTISPSMRMGFMVLPPRLLERYRRELGFYASVALPITYNLS